MPTFEIHPDIRKASTLRSNFYTDPAFFEISKERIFARSWQYLARADAVHGLMPATLLPGFLDEPLLVGKSDDALRCISNVCTHRGKVLVEAPTQANLIRCGYHGRRFSLAGKCLSMPEFEGVEGFPCADDDLREFPFACRNGFIFVSLEPAVTFDDLVADVAERFASDRYEGLTLTATRHYDVNAHWALYCENYLEGFHIPYVHHGLNAVVDYGRYTTETFRYSSLQTALDDEGRVAARYLFLFPNTMFNFYPWGISVNVVRPVSPSTTSVEFLTYVSDPSQMDVGAGADLHGVEMEDEAVVESVQRGVRSRYYKHGRYSPTREQGTHHFHRLIAEFMND